MNRKRIKRWATTVLFLLCLPVAPTPAGNDVVVARLVDRPPASWLQEGEWVGMDVDFYRALEKESGLTFTFIDLPWPRALHDMKKGTCTLMTQLSRNAEREAYIHYLCPYNSEEMVMMVTQENTAVPIKSLDQLAEVSKQRGIPIGIRHGFFYGKAFDQKMKDDPDFSAHFTYVGATIPEMLRRDRLLGVIDQRVAVSHRIRTQAAYKQFAIHPYVIHKDPIYIGVSKHASPDIRKRLEKACGILMRNGTFAAIEAKWKTP